MRADACVILNNGFAGAVCSKEVQVLIDNFSKEEDIRAILAMKRIAVVGLSDQPDRPSYDVARYLQAHDYTIIPVNPHVKEVLGEKAYPDLLALPEPPEVVDIFRRSEFVGPIVDNAIKVGAKAVWMQFDVIDVEAARRARKAGLLVVMDRCMKVEHWQRSGR
jgi:predicted CoA-binding protein